VNAETIVALVVSALILGYLLYTMLRPEEF
jgi:K+-transporting ATPase KdpF subunit